MIHTQLEGKKIKKKKKKKEPLTSWTGSNNSGKGEYICLWVNIYIYICCGGNE